MGFSTTIWDLDDDTEGNVQQIAEHGITQGEVEEVLEHPEGNRIKPLVKQANCLRQDQHGPDYCRCVRAN